MRSSTISRATIYSKEMLISNQHSKQYPKRRKEAHQKSGMGKGINTYRDQVSVVCLLNSPNLLQNPPNLLQDSPDITHDVLGQLSTQNS